MLTIVPENLTIANSYLEHGSIEETAASLRIPKEKVSEVLLTKPVRDYITQVYLDSGYRNRFKLATLLDTMIDTKLQEAIETEFYTKADLLELMEFAHKLRMDEHKINQSSVTNIQVNQDFGGSNYGDLMKKLMS